jgi:hypothetical protein
MLPLFNKSSNILSNLATLKVNLTSSFDSFEPTIERSRLGVWPCSAKLAQQYTLLAASHQSYFGHTRLYGHCDELF